MQVVKNRPANSENNSPQRETIEKKKIPVDPVTTDDTKLLFEANEEPDQEEAQSGEAEDKTDPPASAMASGFSLDGPLAEAAASAGSLIVDAERADSFGFAQEGEESGGGWNLTTILVSGAVAITGIVIWATSDGSNKPPTIDSANQSVSTNEDTPVQITVNATDQDALTYTVTTAPTNGSTSVSGNVITYSPAMDYNGGDSLTVTVTDTKGQTVTQTVAITVTPVNDPPKFQPAVTEKSLFQGQTLSENLAGTATDADGDMLSFAADVNPSHGTLVVNPTGSYVYMPDLEYIGEDSFRVRVSDNNGGTDSRGYTVTINPVPVPEPPTGISPQEAVVEEDVLLSVISTITDPNFDPLTFQIVASPTNGTLFRVIDNIFDYRPKENFNGTDSFVIRGTTPDGEFFDETWNFTITPVNDVPTAPVETELTTPEETPVNVPLTVSDVDLDANLNNPVTDRISPTVLAEDMPVFGTMSVDGNRLIYTPGPGFAGIDTFKVTYTDLAGASVKTTVNVRVTAGTGEPINHDPMITSEQGEFVVNEDESVIIKVGSSDEDGDTPVVTGAAANGAVTKIDNETFRYAPDPDFFGQDTVTFTADDNKGGTATLTVPGTVNPVNDDPMFPDEVASVPTEKGEAVSFDISVGTTDIDSDILTFSNTTEPKNGTVIVEDDGKVIYTPNPDFVGLDTFEVRVIDNDGGSDTATVEVTVGGAEEVSINGALPSEPNDFFDAGTGDWIFNADLTLPIHIEIVDLETGDIIRFSNASMGDIFLRPTGGNPADVFIESMTDPLQHRIYLPNIFPNGPPDSYDFPDAFNAAGFDFIAFQTVP